MILRCCTTEEELACGALDWEEFQPDAVAFWNFSLFPEAQRPVRQVSRNKPTYGMGEYYLLAGNMFKWTRLYGEIMGVETLSWWQWMERWLPVAWKAWICHARRQPLFANLCQYHQAWSRLASVQTETGETKVSPAEETRSYEVTVEVLVLLAFWSYFSMHERSNHSALCDVNDDFVG